MIVCFKSFSPYFYQFWCNFFYRFLWQNLTLLHNVATQLLHNILLQLGHYLILSFSVNNFNLSQSYIQGVGIL